MGTDVLHDPPINERPISKLGMFTHPWIRWFLAIKNESSTGIENVAFFGYDADGGVALDSDGEDIPIKTEVATNAAFTHVANSAEIEINEDGLYQITAECGFDINEDDTVQLAIYRDTGSGYVEVDGAVAYCGA